MRSLLIYPSEPFRTFLLLASIALVSIGCGGPSAGNHKAVAIRMERTACFGKCPVYTLTVEPTGNVTFEGKQFTKTLGKVESRLEDEKMAQLIAAIERADYFNLNTTYADDSDGCPVTATDSPSVNLSVRLGRYEKSIRHYHGCLEKGDSYRPYPAGLTELEKQIDEIVGTDRWIGK